MKRRGFLQTLLGLTGAAALPANSAIKHRPKTIQLLETNIAGFQYYEGENLFAHLKLDDPLQLRRDPSNKYDKCAVEVYWKGNKLGYIPRVANMSVSQILDKNEPLNTYITQLTRSDNPWQSMRIVVEWNMERNNTQIT